MAKKFIRISRIYQTKNKLQLLILKKLELLDHTLIPTELSASQIIKTEYDDALNQYKGKAAIPELKMSKNDNTTIYYIEDVIYIHVLTVINDLTILTDGIVE